MGSFAVNISVSVMTWQHQAVTANGEGVTIGLFHSLLMEVTVMWPRQVTGQNWQVDRVWGGE